MGDLNDSNLEFFDRGEGDIVKQNGFTKDANSSREFITRKESDTTYFLNNGGFKLISVV